MNRLAGEEALGPAATNPSIGAPPPPGRNTQKGRKRWDLPDKEEKF